jgi:hypothetical protein
MATTTTKYQSHKTGETIEIRADFAQASSPIQARYDGGDWEPTPYQVADARHRNRTALRLVLRWGQSYSG